MSTAFDLTQLRALLLLFFLLLCCFWHFSPNCGRCS
jgi:hypothetical protein